MGKQICLMKLKVDGSVKWCQDYGNTADQWGGYCVRGTHDGQYVVVGGCDAGMERVESVNRQ
jgi:hypothetical protein